MRNVGNGVIGVGCGRFEQSLGSALEGLTMKQGSYGITEILLLSEVNRSNLFGIVVV